MQSQGGFEFRVAPKTFHTGKCAVDSLRDDNESKCEMLRTSPKLQRKLDKLRKNLSRKTSAAKLMKTVNGGPFGVKGQSLDEPNSLHRQKMKYFSTFSCSQTSLNRLNPCPDAYALSARTVNSKTNLNSSARSINSLYVYSGPRPSLASETSTFLSYDDEYFDHLDIPGHFNTRGIFGQKANVTNIVPLPLLRSKSDLRLNHLKSLFRENDRQNTFMTSVSSFYSRYQNPVKRVQTTKHVPKLDLQEETSEKDYKITVNVTARPHAVKGNKTKDPLALEKEMTSLSVINSNEFVSKNKRNSVDVCTQTEAGPGEYEDLVAIATE